MQILVRENLLTPLTKSFINYSFGKLPDLSKLDLHILQYNLISFDGNSAPQFLHV